ncbi:helix-turn-helix domain-containing protein [Nonomuraea sp. NPDC046802]|uniref:TetR/AcrR family transcriptional regulator n=1 Tax=Nonomuraea sp. NPDC046802 TaxID=3154919 RepID=UPI00340FF872
MSQSADKKEQILDAALQVFGRYGYRRTSMELIAQAAGVTRPALYQHYANKQDIFHAMAGRAIDQVIDRAEAIGRTDADVTDRVFGALDVKLEFIAGSVEAEFRSEMLAEVATLAPDLTRSFKERQVAVIEAILLTAKDELAQLGVSLSAHDTAVLLLAGLTGLTHQEEPDAQRTHLRQLVELAIRSLR